MLWSLMSSLFEPSKVRVGAASRFPLQWRSLSGGAVVVFMQMFFMLVYKDEVMVHYLGTVVRPGRASMDLHRHLGHGELNLRYLTRSMGVCYHDVQSPHMALEGLRLHEHKVNSYQGDPKAMKTLYSLLSSAKAL